METSEIKITEKDIYITKKSREALTAPQWIDGGPSRDPSVKQLKYRVPHKKLDKIQSIKTSSVYHIFLAQRHFRKAHFLQIILIVRSQQCTQKMKEKERRTIVNPISTMGNRLKKLYLSQISWNFSAVCQ